MAHAPQVKRAALGRLLAGESPKTVARTLGLPYSTVKRWQGAGFAAAGGSALDRLGERLADDLGETLVSGRVLLAELRDPARLAQLDAREIAMLHGGLFDRAVRLLAGVKRS
jgi:hypothetical protein